MFCYLVLFDMILARLYKFILNDRILSKLITITISRVISSNKVS
jgi:hypothetical protein